MSRKRKRRQSRGPAAAVLVLVALVGIGIAFSRLYPGFRRASRTTARHPVTVSTPASPHRQTSAGTRTITGRIYFARVVNGRERMVPVDRELPAEAPAKPALEELISGELPEGCSRPLPKGTQLRSVSVTDGIATADFSGELVSNFEGGSDNEGVAVYSIVNTLASLPGVKQVQILVDGKSIDSIGGHLDVSGPLSADSELVAR
jgi:spore germination protein GerM